MADSRSLALVCALVAVLLLPQPLLAQGPPPVVREVVSSVVRMLESSDEASLQGFAAERLSAEYRGGFAGGALLEHLRALREATRGSTGDLGVERAPDGLVLIFSGEREVRLFLDLDESNGEIRRLDLLEVDAFGDGGESGAVMRHERALEGLVPGADSYEEFTREHLTESLRESLGAEALHQMLARIAQGFARSSAIGLNAGPDGYTIELRAGGDMDIHYRVEGQPPYRIDELSIDTDVAPEGAGVPDRVFTWEGLGEQLERAAADGFAGSVVAVRDGEVVLDAGYGLADREAGRPNDSNTVYDIGSIPIDFTRAAVHLLMQQDQVAPHASIAEFLPDVPDDKQAITIQHLLDGTSGLANFHGRPGDADRDLSWISREEAIRRMMERPLLFDPGADRAPSHSAYGLLAAIVEIVSGDTYGEFLRANFFEPAGMERTGLYGESLRLDANRFAVGYGQQASDPNIPPEWGPASWLVMGSGGMVSSPHDLRRWLQFLQGEGPLEGEWQRPYTQPGAATGGSDRGFMAVTAWDGAGSLIVAASNSGGDWDVTRSVIAGLRALGRGSASQ